MQSLGPRSACIFDALGVTSRTVSSMGVADVHRNHATSAAAKMVRYMLRNSIETWTRNKGMANETWGERRKGHYIQWYASNHCHRFWW